jgi:2-oxoglutarate dehydrogenase E1 component
MVQFVRRNAERHANLFVVSATTPAQLFHALRRQMNRPFQKPLVLLTPKFLLHHRPATSALADFASGTFFNRVIDDCKKSDNTRHLSRHPKTGER